MRADAVIKWLMPKEERFHELLARDTANLVRGARLFADIAGIAGPGSLEQRRVKHVELKAAEHDGDSITRQIFDALNSTFITPFDREDLRALATDLDDILDYLEAVAHNLVLFELGESPEALRQFAEILVGMVQEIDRMTALLWDLANERRIQESIVRISDLENQADRLYSTVIADLFKGNGKNPLEILKWKEVYEGLENACDECKDYTHAVGNVLVKNS
jgi:predicted phosphate transport protein (TIGR00153 family)